MKLAIFPGTFNPIHTAHLIIAENARVQFNLDKIVFITSNVPPHRNNDIASATDRHNMVKLACDNNEFFEASDLELHRQGPSYTYLTVLELKKAYPEIEKINFIIGTDAISQMHTWQHSQDILNICHFLIVSRPGNLSIQESLAKTGLKDFDFDVLFSPLLEISSTLIRDNISKDKSIKYLVLDSVKNYIEKQDLYKKQQP